MPPNFKIRECASGYCPRIAFIRVTAGYVGLMPHCAKGGTCSGGGSLRCIVCYSITTGNVSFAAAWQPMATAEMAWGIGIGIVFFYAEYAASCGFVVPLMVPPVMVGQGIDPASRVHGKLYRYDIVGCRHCVGANGVIGKVAVLPV